MALLQTAEIRTLPLKDEAFRDLERMIVNGILEPGKWVSETDLIEASGHTRAPIRYAIQKLADEGLLRIVPRRGAQICPIDHTEQFRSLELRRVVESLVAKSAAKRATPKQRAALLELAARFAKAAETGEQDAMTELDAKCFNLVVEAADNRFAARALTSVKGLSRRFWVLHQAQYGDIKKMAAAHSKIALAIGNGAEDDAVQAVGELINYVEKFTLEVVGFNTGK